MVLALGLAGFMLPLANIVRNTIASLSEAQKASLAVSAILQHGKLTENIVIRLLSDPKTLTLPMPKGRGFSSLLMSNIGLCHKLYSVLKAGDTLNG